MKKRGPQRKTTQEEDQLIIQKAHVPVRAVLRELNPRNRENDAK